MEEHQQRGIEAAESYVAAIAGGLGEFHWDERVAMLLQIGSVDGR